MATGIDPATVGGEIESLIHKMEALGDAQARSDAQELVRMLMSLYGAGLSRMIDVIRTEGGGPQAVLDRVAGDGLIASLLVLQDLHPHPVHVRVERALAALRPHLPPHLTVTLLGVDEGSVRLRVAPAPTGASGGANLRASLERAIQEAAPEVGVVQIEGLDEASTGGLLQIGRRSAAPAGPEAQ